MTDRPLIGLTPGLNKEGTYLSVREGFMPALLACGARPVLLPLTADEQALRDYAEMLDGFIFTGGGDVDPGLFGQATRPWCGAVTPWRDEMELALCRLVREMGKPTLGVCRGLQVMAIAAGGDVYQDIEREFAVPCPIAHRQPQPEDCPSHDVALAQGSRVRALMGCDRARVNSLHHQAVKDAGALWVTARSDDGLCEAAEDPAHPFFVGVQWHPERMFREHPEEAAIFAGLVAACRGD